MMNYQQAVAYGRKIGCKYYVRNSNGGLLGAFTTREAAEDCKRCWEDEFKNDPFNKGMKVYIITKGAES